MAMSMRMNDLFSAGVAVARGAKLGVRAAVGVDTLPGNALVEVQPMAAV